MAKRKTPEINGGSMADIAFLLLIFFFVATTMDIDSGLSRVLSPFTPPDTKPPEIKERNVFVVLVNMNNALFVEGEVVTDLNVLREKAKEFLLNRNNDENLPEKELKNIPLIGDIWVSKGVISLQNDRSTSYGKYVEVQNEIIAAGNELKNDFAKRQFNKDFEKCSEEEKEAVTKAIPVMISEAEPKDIGGNK